LTPPSAATISLVPNERLRYTAMFGASERF
jgi:hypothetical protein